jgi:hypothetical protein
MLEGKTVRGVKLGDLLAVGFFTAILMVGIYYIVIVPYVEEPRVDYMTNQFCIDNGYDYCCKRWVVKAIFQPYKVTDVKCCYSDNESYQWFTGIDI